MSAYSRAVYAGACPGAGVIGGRLIKGSREAKARMAYLRSLRGKGRMHTATAPPPELLAAVNAARKKAPSLNDLMKTATGTRRTIAGVRHIEAGRSIGKISPELHAWYNRAHKDPLASVYERIQREKATKGGMFVSGHKRLPLIPSPYADFSHLDKPAPSYSQYLKQRGIKGGEGVGDLIQAGVGNWVDWGKAYKAERDSQIDDIKRLESLRDERKRNPKLSRNDILSRYNKGRKSQAASDDFVSRLNNGTAGNVLRGPAGWIRLIGRKARQNKIDALKRELGI